MSKTNLTVTDNISVTAREVDFVTRFAKNWDHLREILGIMRPIRKQPGAVLKSKKATVTAHCPLLLQQQTVEDIRLALLRISRLLIMQTSQ